MNKCEVCNSTNITPYIQISDYNYYNEIDKNRTFCLAVCRSCNHCFCTDKLSLQQLMNIYRSAEYKVFKSRSTVENDRKHLKTGAMFVNNLLHHIGGAEGRTLFEIGSSFGHLLREARSAGFQVKGIEPSHDACKHGREIYGLDLTNCSLENYIEDNACYDVVIAISVFEHVYDLDASIEIVKKLVGNEGLFYIEVPCFDSIPVKLFGKQYIRHMVRNKRGVFHPVEHLRYFTVQSMKHFLTQYFHEVQHIPDPRWKKSNLRSHVKSILGKMLHTSPTGNIVFTARRPKCVEKNVMSR